MENVANQNTGKLLYTRDYTCIILVINKSLVWLQTELDDMMSCCHYKYSHFVITVALFWPEQKLSRSFSYLKNPFNMATPLKIFVD